MDPKEILLQVASLLSSHFRSAAFIHKAAILPNNKLVYLLKMQRLRTATRMPLLAKEIKWTG
jgi:hypothetical protein